MQQLLLGKCSSITFCSWFLHWTRQKWDDVHNALLMFSLWVGQIPFVFQQVKRTPCSMYRLFSWGFIGQDMMIITLSTIIYLIYANIKVAEIIKTLFYTFSCLWEHGWVPPLMSALLFAITLYKPFFWPLFFTRQIIYVFPKLIWAAVTPFRLHTEKVFFSLQSLCFSLVSWISSGKNIWMAAFKMMEKCSKHSQSVDFLLLLEVELGSNGVQQIWVTHRAHILSSLFFTWNNSQKFLVSWDILQMTHFLLVCLQMFFLEVW